MTIPEEPLTDFDIAAQEAVELGNRLMDEDEEADAWEVASGLLAGAVHFWLYARQPCDDSQCDTCCDVDTAEKRMRLLLQEVDQSAKESDYFHTPNDANVGTA